MTGPTPDLLLPTTAEHDASGRLRLGGCPVGELLEAAGTPALLADEQGLRDLAAAYLTAFRSRHPRTDVCFASKALPSPAVAGLFAQEGLGCDVASAGELALALAGGVPAERLVVHGNAKTDRDLTAALEAGAGRIVVDSLDELDRLERLVRGPQRVLIRVIPGVRADTHDTISTGHEGSKFGVPMDQFDAVAARVASIDGLHLEGVHLHVGSQLFDLDPIVEAIRAIAPLGRFETYDVGGGLGVPYHPGDPVPPTLDAYADRVVGAVHEHLGTDCRLIVEPGRSLVARSIVTGYRVVAVKRSAAGTVVAVDGGMGDNLLARLGEVRFAPFILDAGADRAPEVCDVVGPHCESGDRLVQGVTLAEPRVDDLVVVPVTGAYTASLANNYNGMPRPPLLLCRDGEARVVTRRETIADLLSRYELAGSRVP